MDEGIAKTAETEVDETMDNKMDVEKQAEKRVAKMEKSASTRFNAAVDNAG